MSANDRFWNIVLAEAWEAPETELRPADCTGQYQDTRASYPLTYLDGVAKCDGCDEYLVVFARNPLGLSISHQASYSVRAVNTTAAIARAVIELQKEHTS